MVGLCFSNFFSVSLGMYEQMHAFFNLDQFLLVQVCRGRTSVGGYVVNFLPIQLEQGVASSGSSQANVCNKLQNYGAKAPKRKIWEHIWAVPMGKLQLRSRDPVKCYNSSALALTNTSREQRSLPTFLLTFHLGLGEAQALSPICLTIPDTSTPLIRHT